MGNICSSASIDIAKSCHNEIPSPLFLSPRPITIGNFFIKRVLGHGSFGKVLLVEKLETGKLYAMKVINKNSLDSKKKKSHVLTEREILANVHSPFIVRMHYAFQTPDKLCLVFDYFGGKNLSYHIRENKRLTEPTAQFYIAEVLLALKDIHDKKIIYRDLKPENVLMSEDGHICLSDFNLSKEKTENNGNDTICGTPEYIAPEVLLGNSQGPEVDFWGMGILLYEMINGKSPFASQTYEETYKNIIRGKINFSYSISYQAKDLIKKLLNPNPKRRLANIEDIKNHAFFQDLNWKDLREKYVNPPIIPKNDEFRLSYNSSTGESESEDEEYRRCETNPDNVGSEYKNFTYTESM
ncbi:unnamed protein product [Blepharisma stoltei]|uniref:Serine/threonine protein kinase n=1 Tax=Blepharisma stoltei TaxID=1481888 RepID=A0AAU9JHD4_9CILI|nr:unnamed protein product [Blepharisma stoltei]